MTTATVTGRLAIFTAELLDVRVGKHADPTEGPAVLDLDLARRIANEDPSLLFVDVDADDVAAVIANLSAEAAEAGDDDQVELCGRALNGDPAAIVSCLQAMADAAAQA